MYWYGIFLVRAHSVWSTLAKLFKNFWEHLELLGLLGLFIEKLVKIRRKREAEIAIYEDSVYHCCTSIPLPS